MARWLSYHKIFYLYSINSTNITTKLSKSGPPKFAAATGKACQGGLLSSMTVSMMWIYLQILMENCSSIVKYLDALTYPFVHSMLGLITLPPTPLQLGS